MVECNQNPIRLVYKIGNLSPVFSVSESKGEDWLKHAVFIQYIAEPYQVSIQDR